MYSIIDESFKGKHELLTVGSGNVGELLGTSDY